MLGFDTGGVYTAIMVADPEAEDEDPRGGPRVAFQIAASDAIQPRESRNWQRALAAILGLFTLATALQLGLTANISVLPKAKFSPVCYSPETWMCTPRV